MRTRTITGDAEITLKTLPDEKHASGQEESLRRDTSGSMSTAAEDCNTLRYACGGLSLGPEHAFIRRSCAVEFVRTRSGTAAGSLDADKSCIYSAHLKAAKL